MVGQCRVDLRTVSEDRGEDGGGTLVSGKKYVSGSCVNVPI